MTSHNDLVLSEVHVHHCPSSTSTIQNNKLTRFFFNLKVKDNTYKDTQGGSHLLMKSTKQKQILKDEEDSHNHPNSSGTTKPQPTSSGTLQQDYDYENHQSNPNFSSPSKSCLDSLCDVDEDGDLILLNDNHHDFNNIPEETNIIDNSFDKPEVMTDTDHDLVDNSSLSTITKEVITIEHRLQTVLDDVGFQVWLGALLLCDYLIDCGDVLKQDSVLDLGSGTGLTSIVAALFAKSVVCTDHDSSIVKLAETNWKRNSELLPCSTRGHLVFDTLDFNDNAFELGDPSDEKINTFFDASFLIAAEVVYDDDLTDAFFRTIYHLMKRPPFKTLIIALEKRIVFDAEWRDVCSPSFQHFQENLQDLCAIDDCDVRFTHQQIPTEQVPQYFDYNRIPQLELWKVSTNEVDVT